MKLFQSRWVFFLICIVYIFSLSYYKGWDASPASGGDSFGYYLYLPATYIHDDLKELVTSARAARSHHAGFYSAGSEGNEVDVAYQTDNGNLQIKYTQGVAILGLPGFFIGHCIALVTDYEADGFSLPYRISMHFWFLAIALLGLWNLYRILAAFTSNQWVINWTILIIAFGTNFYYFTVYNTIMAHAPLFTIYTFVLLSAQHFHETKKNIYFFISLSFCSLITLIRPVEVFCVLIPLLYGIQGLKDIPRHLKQPFISTSVFLKSVLAVGIIVLPQLLYWYFISGSPISYSYGDEGFNFLSPKLFLGMFSYQNGWLVYSPLMGFALLGILLSMRRLQYSSWLIPLLGIHIYITYSWWCWYYINGIGSRPMVETYAYLAIPLAILLSKARRIAFLKPILSIIFILGMGLSLFQTWQLSKGILWTEAANKQYDWNTFLKTEVDSATLYSFDGIFAQPKLSEFNEIILEQSINNDTDLFYRLTPEIEFGNGFQSQISTQEFDYITARVVVQRTSEAFDLYQNTLLVHSGYLNQKELYWQAMRLNNKIQTDNYSIWGGKANVWDTLTFSMKSPDIRADSFQSKVFLWNLSPHPVLIKEFAIVGLKKKGQY